MPKYPNQPTTNWVQAPGLVATLGPCSHGKEAELADAGVTQFRINSSHLTVAGLLEYIASAQNHAPQIPIIVDLQGAKMRLGDFKPRPVDAGQVIPFAIAEVTTTTQVPLPHSELYHVLNSGDEVSIDDGRLSGRVDSVQNECINVRMLTAGLLSPRKGFNRAVHPVFMDDLSSRDIAIAKAAHDSGCRSFAVSFVADGRECDWVRRQVSPVEVIAKIERQDALVHLGDIARRSDALWVCRGDLGAQLGLLALGRAIAGIDPRKFQLPLWMAGQVLEHLTAHRGPTRSEVCHLYDLIGRGYAGVVLSDETAIGCDPVNAARCARDLANAFP